MKKLAAIALFLALAALPAHAQLGTIQGFCDNGGNHALTSGQPSSNYLQGNIPLCTVSVYYHDTTTLAPIFMGENSTGTLKSVQVTAGGSYSVCPTGVMFTGGGGSGATATVSCTGGAVVSVAVTSPGSGYTTAPTVGFTGGTGSGATATATIVGDLTNPFTANLDGSWRVWAAIATGYDITMSGGISPNAYAQPRTITNIFPNAFGGTSYTIVQANGTASAPVSPVNFINSPTVNFSITGNQISAAVNSGSIIVLKHLGVNLTDQNLLNFWDSPASLSGGSVDAGYQSVVFKTDAIGGLAAETVVATASSQIQQGIVNPPSTAQSIILYPTQISFTSSCNQGTATCGGTTGSSAYMAIGRTGPVHLATATLSDIVLPSGLTDSQVTGVWQCVQGSESGYGMDTVTVSGGGGFAWGIPLSYGNYCFKVASGPGLNYAALSWSVGADCAIGCAPPNPPGFAFVTTYAFVTYSGTAIPNTSLTFQPPFVVQGKTVGLAAGWGLAPVLDVGSANAYIASSAGVNGGVASGLAPPQSILMDPANSNTGASTLAFNGAAAVSIVKAGDVPLVLGDIVAGKPALLSLEDNGTWLLLNPLTGAATISGTISGTATTATHTFGTAFTSTPQCTVTPTSSGVTSFYTSSESTTALTVTYAPSATTNFDVICHGAGNAAW